MRTDNKHSDSANILGHIILPLLSPNVRESQLGDNLKEQYLTGKLLDTSTIACFGSTQSEDSGD